MWEAFVLKWNNLTKEQKFSVCILAVCGLLALGFSAWKVTARITDPFLVPKSELTRIKEIIGSTPQEDEARLKRIDTDGDSLSDWDEINLFKTNPNLKDSCGDGITDNIRVATGKNMQCALTTVGIEQTTDSMTSNPIQSLDSQILGDSPGNVASGTADMASVQPQAPTVSASLEQVLPRDPKAIREVLKGKVDQTKLDALSDEQLLQLFDEAMAVQNKSNGQEQATSVRS